MAKPVDQSRTEWVPKGAIVNGQKVKKGYVAQKGKPEKRVTAKINIQTDTTSGKKAGEVWKYKGGNTVKRVSAGSSSGGTNAAGGPKASSTKARVTKAAQQKPGTRNVSPASSAGAAPSTPAASAKPGTASTKANQKALTAAAKKAAAARAKKADKGIKAGTRYPAPVAPRKAQSGYQAGKGQIAPRTIIEQLGANVGRAWSSMTAGEKTAAAKKAQKIAEAKAKNRKYGIY